MNTNVLLEHRESSNVEQSAQNGYFDILGIFWRRKLILVFVMLFAAAAGVALHITTEPAYQSQADLLVIKKQPQMFPGVNPSQYDTNLSVHQSLITSPLIVGQALKTKEMLELSSLRDDPDAVNTVIKGLKVSHQSKGATDQNSAVLRLSYRSPDAESCPIVLNAIIESFQSFLREAHEDDSDADYELFVRWKDEVQVQLKAKQDAYDKLVDQSNGLTAAAPDAVRAAHERLARVESAHLAQSIRRKELEKQLAILKKAHESGATPQMLSQIAKRWLPEERGSSLDEAILSLTLEERELLSRFGEKHYKVQAVRNTLEFLRGRRPKTGTDTPEMKESDVFAFQQESLRQELAVVQDLEESLQQLATEMKLDVAKVNKGWQKSDMLRKDIISLQDLHKEIVRQVQGLSMVKESESSIARVIAPPAIGKHIAPDPILIGVIVFVIGSIVAGTLALSAEFLDKRFRNSHELRERLGVAVTARIPRLKPARRSVIAQANLDDRRLDQLLCTFFAPDSPQAEAFRSLRTTLLFAQQLQHRNVLQMTSPDHDDGKTTLVSNLAVSLAQAGKRVALLDMDFHRPRLHDVFGLSNEIGLASVLSGEALIEEIVLESGIANLSIVPAGPIPANRSEALLSPHLDKTLAVLSQNYDFVLLDSPPVLRSSDPCVIATHVDGVLMAVNIEQSREKVLRAKEILASVQVELLGVIVNRSDGEEDYALGPLPNPGDVVEVMEVPANEWSERVERRLASQ